MDTFISFLSSGLLANMLAILGLLFGVLPQKDSISIDNSTTYYFESTNTSDSNTSNSLSVIIGLLATYIIYVFFRPYYSVILLFLILLVIMKYRILKIAYRKQMVIPILLVVVSVILTYFSPQEVTNYWNHAYKIDLSQSYTLSRLSDQLTHPFLEIINLFTTVNTSPLSIAILANIVFIFLTTFFILEDLFKSKQNIKITKNGDILFIIITFAVIISFIFYTSTNSPARLAIEHAKYFLSN